MSNAAAAFESAKTAKGHVGIIGPRSYLNKKTLVAPLLAAPLWEESDSYTSADLSRECTNAHEHSRSAVDGVSMSAGHASSNESIASTPFSSSRIPRPLVGSSAAAALNTPQASRTTTLSETPSSASRSHAGRSFSVDFLSSIAPNLVGLMRSRTSNDTAPQAMPAQQTAVRSDVNDCTVGDVAIPCVSNSDLENSGRKDCTNEVHTDRLRHAPTKMNVADGAAVDGVEAKQCQHQQTIESPLNDVPQKLSVPAAVAMPSASLPDGLNSAVAVSGHPLPPARPELQSSTGDSTLHASPPGLFSFSGVTCSLGIGTCLSIGS